jgi:hypothetical protein
MGKKAWIIAAILSAQGLLAQGAPHPVAHAGGVHATEVSFHAHVNDWIKGYTKWSTSHPELLFGPGTPSAQASGQPNDSSLQIDLRWPFLSYFGPDGQLIYAGMESNANVAFLQSLAKAAPNHPAKPLYPPQPPLEVYFDIFPQLQRYKSVLLAHKRPVLLTICQDIAPACKQQNDAIAAVKKRLPALKTQLVEVMIVPDNKQ